MLGVATNPRTTPADEVMREVADDLGVGDTFHHDAGRRVLRRRRGDDGRRPVLRRRRPATAPAASHCGDVHDRLPAQRQEHAWSRTTSTSPSRTAREVHPLTTVTDVAPRDGGGYDVRPCGPTGWLRKRPRTLHRRAGRASRPPRSARRSCCTGCKDDGHLPAHLATGSATCPAPTPSRSSARVVAGQRRRLHPGRRDHLVVPPRRAHPRRAGALRQGQQRDGRCCRPCSPTAAPGAALRYLAARDACGTRCTSLRLCDLRHWSERAVIALVMQSLDNSITRSASAGRSGTGCVTQAGPRRAQPDLDPGRQRGRPRDGATNIGGFAGRHVSASRSTCRSPRTSSAAARSATRRTTGVDRPVPAGLRPRRACTSSTARRSRPTSASTRR